MRPKEHKTTGSDDLFRARLDQIINRRHELVPLGLAARQQGETRSLMVVVKISRICERLVQWAGLAAHCLFWFEEFPAQQLSGQNWPKFHISLCALRRPIFFATHAALKKHNAPICEFQNYRAMAIRSKLA
jgi:IS5 family transposase